MTKHTPPTPLPWYAKDNDVVMDTRDLPAVQVAQAYTTMPWLPVKKSAEHSHANAAYIAHACNAYPKLVEALRMHGRCEHGGNHAHNLLRELGEL